MANPNPTRLEIIIAALDRATGPLRALAGRLREFRRAAGLDKLSEALGGVSKGFGRVFSEAGRLIALAGGAAFAIGAIVNKATEAGDALGLAAERADLTVDAYSEFGFAAAKAGVDQDKFTDAIDTFTKNIGEAKLGKGKLTSFLKDLSPQLLRNLQGAKGNEAALNVMFKALVRVQDPAKRAALAMKAFGSNGKLMTAIIAGGFTTLQEAREEYRRLAGSSQEFVDRAQEMDTELDILKATLTGLGRGVMVEVFPAFIQLAKMFNKFLVENRGQIKAWAKEFGEKLIGFARRLPGYLAALGAKFSELKAKLEPLAKRVGGFGNLLGIIAGLIIGGPLIAAIGSLAAAFISLGIVLATTPVGWVILGIAAAAFLVIKNWSSLKTFFTDLWTDVTDLFQGFSDFVSGVFTGDMKKAWEGLGKIFGSTGDIAKSGLKSLAYINPITAPFAIARSFLVGDKAPEAGPMAQQPTAGAEAAGTPVQRPSIGAEAARASIQRSVTETKQTQTAQVNIDMTNVPRGTKVSLPRTNTANVALNVGYNPVLAQ
jgi:hypothetical protein